MSATRLFDLSGRTALVTGAGLASNEVGWVTAQTIEIDGGSVTT